MDVIYDANAARELLLQMNKYCSSVVKEGEDLLDLTTRSEIWDDVQKRAFANGINEIVKDLNFTLAQEKEYMNTFKQRIIELRG